MRPIDADALLKAPNVRKVTEYDEGGWDMSYFAVPVEVVKSAPTVDVAPTEHARWVSPKTIYTDADFECSYCHWLSCYKTSFCPRCGRKMYEE